MSIISFSHIQYLKIYYYSLWLSGKKIFWKVFDLSRDQYLNAKHERSYNMMNTSSVWGIDSWSNIRIFIKLSRLKNHRISEIQIRYSFLRIYLNQSTNHKKSLKIFWQHFWSASLKCLLDLKSLNRLLFLNFVKLVFCDPWKCTWLFEWFIMPLKMT